jgi:hypothetical protein
MQNFIDALSAARRKSILTGQPLTNQEISGLSSGYFDAAGNMNTRNRALAISEKNAADALAMERYNTEQQMEMAKKAQETQMYGNILQTGATALGTDYMVSKPGESMISKGAGLVKDVGGNVLNYGADLLGMGSETIPTFTEALTPALIDATGTGGGVSLLPEAGGAIVPDAALTAEAGIGGGVAAGGAALTAGAETGIAPLSSFTMGGANASTATYGAAGTGLGLGTIAPYLGPAAAGYAAPGIVNAIHEDTTENLGHNLTLGLVRDEGTADFLGSVGAGAAAGAAVGSFVPVVGTVVGGLVGGVAGGVAQAWDGITNGIADVFGTFVCTELYRQGHLTKEVFEADAQFGKQMDKVEYAWYKTWGIPLAVRMKKSKLISRIVSFFMKPVSLYMAAEMGVGQGSLFGKMCFRVLQLVCRWRMK